MVDQEILDSWKEISAYLNRSIKTCQRWESVYRLPVHRLDGSPKASIFAYKDELDDWLHETLRPKDVKFAFNPRILLFLTAAILVLAVIFLFLWKPWTGQDLSFIPPEELTLAVLFFQNDTGDENLDVWTEGISRMLITKLIQSRRIKVLSDDRLYSILHRLDLSESRNYTTEQLKSISELSSASHVVKGYFTKSADILRIYFTLQDSENFDIVGTDYVESRDVGDFIRMADDLSPKIMSCLGIAPFKPNNEEVKSLAEITTPSAEAYRYYSEGVKYYHRVDYRVGIPLMEHAIDVDPEFALAWLMLSRMHHNRSNLKAHKKALEQAVKHKNRGPRWAQFLIDGSDYYMKCEYREASELFEQVINIVPDQAAALRSLAAISSNSGIYTVSA